MGPCVSKKDGYGSHNNLNRLSSDETIHLESYLSHPNSQPTSSYNSKRVKNPTTDCTTVKRSSVNTLE